MSPGFSQDLGTRTSTRSYKDLVTDFARIFTGSFRRRDTTRQHAKTTVDMPKGLFPSTCQTKLSPSTCQKSVRRCAKMMVSVNMPRICVRRHAKTPSYSVTVLGPQNFRHLPRAGSTCIFYYFHIASLKFYRHYF